MITVHLFEELLSLVTCFPGPVPLVFRGHVHDKGTVVHLWFWVWYLRWSHRDHPVVVVQLREGDGVHVLDSQKHFILSGIRKVFSEMNY